MTSTTILNNFKWTVNYNDSISKHILKNELWEPHLTKFIEIYLKEGQCVLDIGANFGWHTLTMSKCVGKNGIVYAFEPLHENINLLKKNISQNNIENVTVQSVALGNVRKKSTVCNSYLREDKNIGDSFISHHYNERDGDSDMTIDDFIGKENMIVKLNKQITYIEKLDNIKLLKKVDFIKLDVQGFEFMVLEGSQNILKNDRPIIAIELESPCCIMYGYDCGKLIDYLRSFKYTLYFLYADYPADHIAVPIEKIEEFESVFENKIFDHTENNSLNDNFKHGINKKIVL